MSGIGRLPVILKINVVEHNIYYVQRCSESTGMLKALSFVDEGPLYILFLVFLECEIIVITNEEKTKTRNKKRAIHFRARASLYEAESRDLDIQTSRFPSLSSQLTQV